MSTAPSIGVKMGKPEDMYRDLCENAHDLIQSVSPEGRFLYVNRAWRETLGYTPDEIQKLSVFDVIHPDCHDYCRRMFRRLLEGEAAVPIDAEFVAKDGRKILVEGGASCRFENGKPVATRGIFRDVTAGKLAEQELDMLFEVSMDLLCVAGTDGYFKQVNPAFERVLGYTREELLSRSFLELVHPDDREPTQRAVERLASGLPVVDFQNRYLSKRGDYRWLAWRSTPIPDRGLIYAVARDITEQKRIEALMMQQAEDLARSNADLERFAYVASHDLRAPLRAVNNLSEWIAEELGDGAPPKVNERLDELRNRVQLMVTLIDELLAYSRVKRQVEDLSRVDVAVMVEELTFLLAPPEGFVVEAGPGLPVFETAKSPLEQVIRNLIENAIKYHDRAAGRVVVGAVERRDSYEFSVADDGPGIPAEARQKIFQMFQRLPPGDVTGTGMGLALVKRIVDVHGGRVWVDSTEGRGATFRFTWPKRITQNEGEHAEHPRGR